MGTTLVVTEPTSLAPSTAARLKVHMFDDGPRVLDTDLATALGMGAPRNIRPDLIRPNKAELEGLGVLQEVSAKSSDSRGRGRPAKAYYLNEEQALLVCVLSRTEAAKLVRAKLIQAFMVYRLGIAGWG